MNKKFIGFFCAVFLFVLLVFLSGRVLITDKASPCGVSRQIQYSFTLTNKHARAIENVALWVYVPVKETATQVCKSIEASHPYELITDACGNRILYFSFDDMPPYASQIVSLKSNLRVSERPAPVADDRGVSWFLKPEPFVESDHPALVARAQALKKSDRLATAESFFKWVSTHIQYSGYTGPEQGAWHAYVHRSGDCTEYMDLFAALCRAGGIPCRRMGGYICSKSKVVTGSEYHNWAEFYLDGKWHIADPQNRRFMENPDAYIAVNIISSQCSNELDNCNRFRVQGNGIDVKMNS